VNIGRRLRRLKPFLQAKSFIGDTGNRGTHCLQDLTFICVTQMSPGPSSKLLADKRGEFLGVLSRSGFVFQDHL
jgi:hypothetical protein